MVPGRQWLLSTSHSIRTAGTTFHQFMQDYEDIKFTVVQSQILTHLDLAPEHKGKQREPTRPSQMPVTQSPFQGVCS